MAGVHDRLFVYSYDFKESTLCYLSTVRAIVWNNRDVFLDLPESRISPENTGKVLFGYISASQIYLDFSQVVLVYLCMNPHIYMLKVCMWIFSETKVWTTGPVRHCHLCSVESFQHFLPSQVPILQCCALQLPPLKTGNRNRIFHKYFRDTRTFKCISPG